ncbi:MAG: metallophosphatase [Armatimonadetes bacterium]|nr:metallophosphatase [Armatimonadota bacterium]
MLCVPRFRLSTALLCLILALALTSVAHAAERPECVSLTILHTNDVHGRLFPFDYDKLGEREKDVGGAARRAALIRQIKASAGHPVLVMDAGDCFTSGPLAALEGVPDFDVMNAIPYDVMTLGNHDFDGDLYRGQGGTDGLKILHDRIKQARFSILSANAFDASTGKAIVPPYHIFDLAGVKVGVFGLTTARDVDYRQHTEIKLAGPIATARQVVAELGPKCDFLIALTHIGYPYDLQLAHAVPEIDVIVGGHTHTWIFQPQLYTNNIATPPNWWIGGTIVCQAGEWGKCLGRLDLSLRLSGAHRYRVSSFSGELIGIDSSIKPAEDIERILAGYAEPAK